MSIFFGVEKTYKYTHTDSAWWSILQRCIFWHIFILEVASLIKHEQIEHPKYITKQNVSEWLFSSFYYHHLNRDVTIASLAAAAYHTTRFPSHVNQSGSLPLNVVLSTNVSSDYEEKERHICNQKPDKCFDFILPTMVSQKQQYLKPFYRNPRWKWNYGFHSCCFLYITFDNVCDGTNSKVREALFAMN